jgi:hypothetical protein
MLGGRLLKEASDTRHGKTGRLLMDEIGQVHGDISYLGRFIEGEFI